MPIKAAPAANKNNIAGIFIFFYLLTVDFFGKEKAAKDEPSAASI